MPKIWYTYVLKICSVLNLGNILAKLTQVVPGI